MRALAEARSPEAIALAEDMIEIAKAVSATEAIAVGLVDFIANDLDDLLRQLDGFEVQMSGGPRVLNTSNALVEDFGMTFIEQLLDILVNPNIVFLLVTIGVQAILIEISNPGGWVAGFIGATCLLLAAYGFGVLPVNWFGVIFLIIAFILFFLEIQTPTMGALTAAGVVSFIVGGLVLFNSPGVPAFQRVSIPLVVGTAIVTGLAFVIIVGFAVRAFRMPLRTGRESVLGTIGIAASDIAPAGQVLLHSENWSAELAEGEKRIKKGQEVEVLDVQGLRLKVRRKR
jgi:membrane-bound serine protease (ClpP class)